MAASMALNPIALEPNKVLKRRCYRSTMGYDRTYVGSMTQGDSNQTTAPLTAAIDGLLDVDPDTSDDIELAEACRANPASI
jgi:hypothetical protein